MALFTRIASAGDLPKIGDRETPTLDFKMVLSTLKATGKPDTFEAAKDVAALASVYGGVLVIGAHEDRATGELAHWKYMTQVDAHQAVKTIEFAVRDRCVPVPVIDVIAIEAQPGDYVVAVNVMPVPDQPVAVRVRGDADDGYGDPAWVYHARFSTHAIPLRPDQVAMLMNPQIRRAIILLESIPASQRDRVTFTWHTYTDQQQRVNMGTESDYKIVEIDPMANCLHLETKGAALWKLRIPLDDVETVWESKADDWMIRVSGAFDPSAKGKYMSRTN